MNSWFKKGFLFLQEPFVYWTLMVGLQSSRRLVLFREFLVAKKEKLSNPGLYGYTVIAHAA